MSLVREDYPGRHIIGTAAHKINRATTRITRVISTEEVGVGYHPSRLRGLDAYHSRVGLCRIGPCLPLRSSIVTGIGLS